MKLHDFLIKNKVSSAEFARMIGTSRANIHNIRTGKCRPNLKSLKKITLATHGIVGIDDFLNPKEIAAKVTKVQLISKN